MKFKTDKGYTGKKFQIKEINLKIIHVPNILLITKIDFAYLH